MTNKLASQISAILFGVVLFMHLSQANTALASESRPLFRFWSSTYKVHFYTQNLKEKDQLITNYDDNTWVYERLAFSVHDSPITGKSKPVYRFWSMTNNAHFFTISEGEKSYIEKNFPKQIWQYEGIAFYAFTSGSVIDNLVPIFRFWSAQYKTHFYTSSQAEKAAIIKNFPTNIWKYEGIAFHAETLTQLDKPTQVSSNCPVSTGKCVPCTSGEQYCRIEIGKPSGFKGWACQNNNPGNIRSGTDEQFKLRNSIIIAEGAESACGERSGYMVFRDYVIGRNALRAYLRGIANNRHPAYLPTCKNGNCTLKQFFSIYAPAGDQNNPNSYANNVAKYIEVNPDTTTLKWVVTNKLDKFATAIQTQEGWFVK